MTQFFKDKISSLHSIILGPTSVAQTRPINTIFYSQYYMYVDYKALQTIKKAYQVKSKVLPTAKKILPICDDMKIKLHHTF